MNSSGMGIECNDGRHEASTGCGLDAEHSASSAGPSVPIDRLTEEVGFSSLARCFEVPVLEMGTVNEKKKRQSRREFARSAALFTVAVPLAGAGALAEKTAAIPPATPTATQEELPTLPADFPKLTEQSRAEVEARHDEIVKQYSGRFSAEQKAELRRLSYMAQPGLDRLRAYTLRNGDGPALFLKPVVEREKKPALSAKPAASAPVVKKP